MVIYSGTSHNRLSEIWTASIQQTNNVPPIDFAIETIHFQPPRDGQPLISRLNGQNTCPQRTSSCTNSLQEQTEIIVPDENCYQIFDI